MNKRSVLITCLFLLGVPFVLGVAPAGEPVVSITLDVGKNHEVVLKSLKETVDFPSTPQPGAYEVHLLSSHEDVLHAHQFHLHFDLSAHTPQITQVSSTPVQLHLPVQDGFHSLRLLFEGQEIFRHQVDQQQLGFVEVKEVSDNTWLKVAVTVGLFFLLFFIIWLIKRNRY